MIFLARLVELKKMVNRNISWPTFRLVVRVYDVAKGSQWDQLLHLIPCQRTCNKLEARTSNGCPVVCETRRKRKSCFSIENARTSDAKQQRFARAHAFAYGQRVFARTTIAHQIETCVSVHGADSVWPNWAIYCTLGNFLKPVATIDFPRLPTF